MASVTPEMITVINKSLSLTTPVMILLPLNRPNIYLSMGKKTAIVVRHKCVI